MPIYLSFISKANGNRESIDVTLDKHLKAHIVANRKILASIVDTIIFCGRRGIAVRGYRDDSKYFPCIGDYSTERKFCRTA